MAPILTWVKRSQPGRPLEAFSGVQLGRVRVYARSSGASAPPNKFLVWEKDWFVTVRRALKLKRRPFKTLSKANTKGTVSLSEAWVVAPPKFPGQAEYYFEDDASPRNRSEDPLCVTTKQSAVVVKGVVLGGTLVKVTDKAVELEIPIRAEHTTKVVHKIAAVVDPPVKVRLLLPWLDGDHDLTAAALRWIESRGHTNQLIEAARSADHPTDSARDALVSIVDGLLPQNAAGWTIAFTDGVVQLGGTVTPTNPLEVGVHITAPPEGGRATYAIAVVHPDGVATIGRVVELTAADGSLHIGDLS